ESSVSRMRGNAMWMWKDSRSATSTTSLPAKKPPSACATASHYRGSAPFETGSRRLNPSFRRSSLHRFRVNLDPADVGKTAEAVTASGRQIDKPDLIDSGQIHFVEQNTLGLDFFDVQLQPSDVRKVKLTFVKIEGIRVRVISNEPRAVGQFHDRTYLMKTRR